MQMCLGHVQRENPKKWIANGINDALTRTFYIQKYWEDCGSFCSWHGVTSLFKEIENKRWKMNVVIKSFTNIRLFKRVKVSWHIGSYTFLVYNTNVLVRCLFYNNLFSQCWFHLVRYGLEQTRCPNKIETENNNKAFMLLLLWMLPGFRKWTNVIKHDVHRDWPSLVILIKTVTFNIINFVQSLHCLFICAFEC